MSGFDEIETAVVIRYPYLWSREASRGETEGRKGRPVVVGVRLARADGDMVLFFPITTKHPETDRFAIEILRLKSAGPVLMQICGFGSFWMSITATLSDILSTWSRSHLWDGLVRLFFSPSFGSLLHVAGRPARFTVPGKDPCDVRQLNPTKRTDP